MRQIDNIFLAIIRLLGVQLLRHGLCLTYITLTNFPEGGPAIRLEHHILNIRDIQTGNSTAVHDGVLTINKSELEQLILEDTRFSRVDIELAWPGEKSRIVQVIDVIEPTAKVPQASSGLDYQIRGSGGTMVLRGAAVVLSDYREPGQVTTSKDPDGEIIDMSGPAAEISPYGKTFNIVILALPGEQVDNHEYLAAFKAAGLKVSSYLAARAIGENPDDIEVYDLPPLAEISPAQGELPRVVYIFQIISHQFEPVSGEPTYYGRQIEQMLPTLIHPNEILDGVLTSPHPGLNVQTYQIQNHPIIKELYSRHGRDICFTGVIITTAPNTTADFEWMADRAAGLAKWVVGADAAILTKCGGGAPELALAYTARSCERLGIKTAVAMLQMGADIRDTKYGASTIFDLPEVDAMVSMGMPFMELALPAVDRIIGRPGKSRAPRAIEGEIVRAVRWIKGSLCQLGSSKLKAVRY